VTKELLFSVTLADCDVQTFRSGGPGGQNQNKRETGVRIVHRESGAVGESREERSQLQNKRTAFERMVKHPKFQFWVHEKRREMETGKSLEDRVAEMMQPEYIRTEVRENGLWNEDTNGSSLPK
jgi:protein subunit release factor B